MVELVLQNVDRVVEKARQQEVFSREDMPLRRRDLAVFSLSCWPFVPEDRTIH